jgi:hypothetical protein
VVVGVGVGVRVARGRVGVLLGLGVGDGVIVGVDVGLSGEGVAVEVGAPASGIEATGLPQAVAITITMPIVQSVHGFIEASPFLFRYECGACRS